MMAETRNTDFAAGDRDVAAYRAPEFAEEASMEPGDLNLSAAAVDQDGACLD